jgi:hypothetical protein
MPESLAASGVSLAAVDGDGLQPLHYAACDGQLEAAQWLAAAPGVSLTAAEGRGLQAVVHHAAIAGCLALLQWLAAQPGVSLTVADHLGLHPVHHAAHHGRLGAVQWLAGCPGVSLTATDTTGWQPLHDTAVKGQLTVLQWLIDQPGVSLTAQTHDSSQVLHIAATHGQAGMLQWLAQRQGEVDLSAPGPHGLRALHLAAQNLHVDALCLLFNAGVEVCGPQCATCARGLAALGKRRVELLAEAQARVRRLTPMYTDRVQLAVAASEVAGARGGALASWEARLAAEEQRLEGLAQQQASARGGGRGRVTAGLGDGMGVV